MPPSKYASCVQICDSCAIACDSCAMACLKEPQPRALARCIALDIDCAAVCRLTAAVLARHSLFAASICRLCAEVCEACADECECHPEPHCRKCAEICRLCAAECRQVR